MYLVMCPGNIGRRPRHLEGILRVQCTPVCFPGSCPKHVGRCPAHVGKYPGHLGRCPGHLWKRVPATLCGVLGISGGREKPAATHPVDPLQMEWHALRYPH